MSHWPKVTLAEVLRHRKQFREIDDLQSYKRCRVQLHAQGIALRDTVPGSEIKTKKQQVCQAGDFLVAEIDAKLGGFGIVPLDLDSAIVSSHYFLYEVLEERLERRFLNYFIRTPGFQDQVNAQGSTNYAAIRPRDVLNYTIPLPPLDEQRRLVVRVDELAIKVEEAKSLRRIADSQSKILSERLSTVLYDGPGWPELPLGDLLSENSRNGLSPRPSDLPPGLPILRISAATSRADGIINESDFKYLDILDRDQATYTLKRGDLLACRFNGNLRYVGRFAMYEQYLGGIHVYPDKLIRFRLDTSRVLPEFACLALNSPLSRSRIEALCATTAGNIGISATDLKTIPVPVPPLAEQRLLITYVKKLRVKVDAIKCMQLGTGAELDALVPAILNQAFQGQLS